LEEFASGGHLVVRAGWRGACLDNLYYATWEEVVSGDRLTVLLGHRPTVLPYTSRTGARGTPSYGCLPHGLTAP
jgi:hypothetical protein